MFLGIDIGSSSTKVAIINNNNELLAVSVINMGTGTNAHEKAINDVLSQVGINLEDIKFTVATGYGRLNLENTDKQITEITCHAKGVNYLVGEANTIVDIGGQDAKVIKLSSDGKVSNFVMNEKCAAGTGRFMEVMARVLGCDLSDLSGMADKSTKSISISNVCTVFAESEVISRLSAGEKLEDVARGSHVAIAKRVMGMCNRVGYSPKVVMTGGVALNTNLVQALSEELGCDVEVAPHSQAVGAIGAAVFAHELFNKEENDDE